jgi:3-methylcrotonyl-CoA carboxylase alpha subunit
VYYFSVHKVKVQSADGQYNIQLENGVNKTVQVTQLNAQHNRFTLRTNIDGKFSNISTVISPEHVAIFNDGGKIELEFIQPKFLIADAATSNASSVVSPMPGVLDKIHVQVGAAVKMGDPLAVIIAMKMEHVLKAPRDGVVKSVGGVAGQNLAKGAVVVKFEEEDVTSSESD